MLEGLWKRKSFTCCWPGVETGVSNTEFSMEVSQIPNKNTAQLCHSWVDTRTSLRSTHHRETCTSVCIAAPYTIVRKWNQPRCPSSHTWIKRIQCRYTTELYSVIEKNKTVMVSGKGWNWKSFH